MERGIRQFRERVIDKISKKNLECLLAFIVMAFVFYPIALIPVYFLGTAVLMIALAFTPGGHW